MAVTHDGEDDGYRDLAAMFGIDRPPVEAVDMVAFLLDWGADIEARNGGGETPLLTAAGGTRTPDVVRLLLARGADVSAKNTWGRTACDMAVPMGGWVHTDVMTQLCDESRKWLTTGFWRTANTADVREQFDGRADINAQDTAGERALYKAVSWNRDPEVVALLLNLDADIEAVEPQHGNRPLHKAVENGNLIFTSLLLSRGAEVNAKDNNGTTPIHMASRYASDEAGLEMVRLLLDRGANPRARDNQRRYASAPSVLASRLIASDGGVVAGLGGRPQRPGHHREDSLGLDSQYRRRRGLADRVDTGGTPVPSGGNPHAVESTRRAIDL